MLIFWKHILLFSELLFKEMKDDFEIENPDSPIDESFVYNVPLTDCVGDLMIVYYHRLATLSLLL